MNVSQKYLRWVKLAALSVLAVSVFACTTTSSNRNASRKADSQGMYRVKSGDTLSLIASANGVRYTDIMAWNSLYDPDHLEVGWRLRVRPNASASPSVGVTPPPVVRAEAVTTVSDPEIKSEQAIVNPVSWVWPHSAGLLRGYDGNLTKGIVFAGERGSVVLAASGGEVIYAGSGLRGYGNMVVIKHNDTWSSVYANNERLLVKQGERVIAGEQIATMGSSDASRVQMYFEVRQNAKPMDPMKVLPARALK